MYISSIGIEGVESKLASWKTILIPIHPAPEIYAQLNFCNIRNGAQSSAMVRILPPLSVAEEPVREVVMLLYSSCIL